LGGGFTGSLRAHLPVARAGLKRVVLEGGRLGRSQLSKWWVYLAQVSANWRRKDWSANTGRGQCSTQQFKKESLVALIGGLHQR